MYAQENKGNLVWAGTDDETETNPNHPPTTSLNYGRMGWVIDQPATTNTPAAVKAGALWKYNPAADLYRCPSSREQLLWRSYSISHFMNGEAELNGSPADPILTPIITKLTKTKGNMLVFIEEYDQRTVAGGGPSYNQGSFLLWKWQNQPSKDQWWVDLPGLYHKVGTTMSYADGHAEFKIWADRRTLQLQPWPSPKAATPLSNDVKEMKFAMYGT
jgi:prepilin-type processing-associated H-X9-DG protein